MKHHAHKSIKLKELLTEGNVEVRNAIKSSVGKQISNAEWDKEHDVVRLDFSDGTHLYIFDGDHQCCEERFMQLEEDPKILVGHTFRGVKLKPMQNIDDSEWVKNHPGHPDEDFPEAHEIQFVDILTDRDVVQVAMHNRHNGYYSGFKLSASLKDPATR